MAMCVWFLLTACADEAHAQAVLTQPGPTEKWWSRNPLMWMPTSHACSSTSAVQQIHSATQILLRRQAD